MKQNSIALLQFICICSMSKGREYYDIKIKPYDLSQSPNLFQEFNDIYKYTYNNKIEYAKHHQIFRNNLRKINALDYFSVNKTVFGINKFSNLDLKMVTDFYTGFNGSGLIGSEQVFNVTVMGEAPVSLDWRGAATVVSPVREQEPCKYSYVYSAVDQIESQFALLRWYSKEDNVLMNHLSDKQAFDCEPTGNCANGGVPHLVMEALKEEGGAVLEEVFYMGSKGLFGVKDKCLTEPSQVAVKVVNVRHLSFVDEDTLKQAVAHYGPLSVSIYVSESVRHYSTGVLQPFDCEDGAANHAVLLVGYGEAHGTSYWIIKNSWGQEWGRDGFLYLVRGRRACRIGEYVATAAVEMGTFKLAPAPPLHSAAD